MRQTFSVTSTVRYCGLALLPALLLLPQPALAQETTTLERGEMLYRVHCSGCHGDGARGDGSVASWLLIEPADLTKINERNQGRFPRARVYRMIDGRQEVRVHGERQMPVWGLTFQDFGRSDDQEVEVVDRIDALMTYLESIQELAAGAMEEPEATEPAPAVADEERVTRGWYAYQRYCQSCHGEGGLGDGRVGQYLKVPPADLTQLSENHGGEFPAELVRRVIDGREGIRLHGRREMPIWGEVLAEEESEVNERVLDLVAALRSLDRDG